MSKLLRGGRIGSARKDVVEFTASIKSDQKLLEAVIKINQAHAEGFIELWGLPTKVANILKEKVKKEKKC